jgi:lysozyme
MILGIDVSAYQGAVDWHAAHASGVVFAFAKASEGTTFTDSRFARNIAKMRTAGVVPGGYHFLTSTSSVAAQADHFCSLVDGHMIHALDVEGAHLDAAGWVARYRHHFPKKTLLIYTGRDLWTRAGGGDGAHLGPLWAAGYVPNAYLKGASLQAIASRLGSHRGGVPFSGWTSAQFVQFTDDAHVPGVASGCDGNAFFGTLTQLQALALPQPPEDDVTPQDIEAIAKATVTQLLAAEITLGPFASSILTDRDGQPTKAQTVGNLLQWAAAHAQSADTAVHKP